MREEIEEKLDNLIELLDSDDRLKKIEILKNKLISDTTLIGKINNLKCLDIYSDEYKKIKKELFELEEFVDFKELETEIDYLILEINSKLKELTNERRCVHENN